MDDVGELSYVMSMANLVWIAFEFPDPKACSELVNGGLKTKIPYFDSENNFRFDWFVWALTLLSLTRFPDAESFMRLRKHFGEKKADPFSEDDSALVCEAFPEIQGINFGYKAINYFVLDDLFLYKGELELYDALKAYAKAIDAFGLGYWLSVCRKEAEHLIQITPEAERNAVRRYADIIVRSDERKLTSLLSVYKLSDFESGCRDHELLCPLVTREYERLGLVE